MKEANLGQSSELPGLFPPPMAASAKAQQVQVQVQVHTLASAAGAQHYTSQDASLPRLPCH